MLRWSFLMCDFASAREEIMIVEGQGQSLLYLGEGKWLNVTWLLESSLMEKWMLHWKELNIGKQIVCPLPSYLCSWVLSISTLFLMIYLLMILSVGAPWIHLKSSFGFWNTRLYLVWLRTLETKFNFIFHVVSRVSNKDISVCDNFYVITSIVKLYSS